MVEDSYPVPLLLAHPILAPPGGWRFRKFLVLELEAKELDVQDLVVQELEVQEMEVQ